MPDEAVAGWTAGKIAGLSLDQRHQLWKNARAATGVDASRLVEMIENVGLPFSDDACLRTDDPVTIKMYEIINSPEGRAACLSANEAGYPAIAGVDPMLNQQLGIEYRGGNMATATAGGLVGELMRSLGYQHAGQRKMPPGSIAKSGAVWKRR